MQDIPNDPHKINVTEDARHQKMKRKGHDTKIVFTNG